MFICGEKINKMTFKGKTIPPHKYTAHLKKWDIKPFDMSLESLPKGENSCQDAKACESMSQLSFSKVMLPRKHLNLLS